MKYLASTVADYVVKQSTAEGKCLFVLPSHSPQLLLKIGRLVEEGLARLPNRRARLLYGVAFRLGQEWSSGGSEPVRTHFQLLRGRGWYNEDNNLTRLRNELRNPITTNE